MGEFHEFIQTVAIKVIYLLNLVKFHSLIIRDVSNQVHAILSEGIDYMQYFKMRYKIYIVIHQLI